MDYQTRKASEQGKVTDMHLVRMSFGGVPPFTEPVMFKFDQQVNLFVGPNASGKSTVLQMIADCLIGPDKGSKRPISQGRGLRRLSLINDDAFDELVYEDPPSYGPLNFLSASKDWLGTRYEPVTPEVAPSVINIDSFREGLPGISDLEDPDAYGETAAEILEGSFSGPRTMYASKLLGEELWRPDIPDAQTMARVVLMDAVELADACSKSICDEVIRDSFSHNYIHGPDVRDWLAHPAVDPNNIPIQRLMGINTTDIRNFENLSIWEEPSYSAYTEDTDSVPIFLGHLSSGTEGTLLWIRWLALKMVHHYEFERGWEKKPAILLIDEIENHLHPTWQRRVIPALLEHFPGLQIFATTHSPFMVAGLKAGQVHLLKRDANGVVTASTNERDVIGWTADEILRTMMGVDEPTDQLTVDRANRLRQLREKETLTPEEESELNALRRQVNEDLMSKGGPLEVERERYADLMERFLRSQQSELTQDGD